MGERFIIAGFGGALLHSDDAGYDDARKVFNGMVDRHPAVIATVSSAEDVARAIKLGATATCRCRFMAAAMA